MADSDKTPRDAVRRAGRPRAQQHRAGAKELRKVAETFVFAAFLRTDESPPCDRQSRSDRLILCPIA